MQIDVNRQNNGWGISRDGRLIETPRHQPWVVPTSALAEALADEWRAQNPKKLDWQKMPLGQLVQAALDHVAVERDQIVAEMLRYVGSELLCQRTDYPMELATHQANIWQPLLDWFAKKQGVTWQVGTGVMPIKQSSALSDKLQLVTQRMDDFTLAGFRHTAQTCGSLVLALALAAGRIDSEECYRAAEVERHYQIDQWGADEELQRRLEALKAELVFCQKWFRLLSPEA
ncbi:MAG: ATPase [Alphaproteobacteria bacterium]|nr:ATPase [Alphaproteobacteria bacterium]MBV8547842.1 ATPase [Alphaproteobacteria bacterium]